MEHRYRFTDEHVGCWLDGHFGWRNSVRAVRIAQTHAAFKVSPEEEAELRGFMSGAPGEWDIEDILDRAMAALADRTAPGLYWTWDMGELSLVPACQDEGEPMKPVDCEHYLRGSFA